MVEITSAFTSLINLAVAIVNFIVALLIFRSKKTKNPHFRKK
ncbi:hypothetical protein [Tenuibacillus multivorans]|nr:hypothetical protein [Tenuibacillus multivorans]